ncbi:thioredoxin family protein [Galbibacter sp.]|jgi:thiol-disulfide isomerase/thioredoxin|uniref:thioredoxin family protein n=1 Tax=Galbibacter sp. TaxID=2918471 RepID=UPI003A904DD6
MKLLKGQITPLRTTILIIALGFGLMACQSGASKSNKLDYTKQASVDQDKDSILVGKHSRKQLEQAPYNQWFDANYKEYQANAEVVAELEPLLDGITVKIFMGTWCSDSQHNVPAFFKIMDQAGYEYNDFELYSMTEQKVTPENFEEGLDVINVPTIIIYKDDKEVNRLVEYPINSIEKDLLDILQGKDYKNPYAL